MRIEERAERLRKIRDILGDRRIGSQEMLIALLREQGLRITQATLARDLKRLNVGKIADGNGGYAYSLPDENRRNGSAQAGDPEFIVRGFLSLEFSGNLGVIKTLPGYANSIASGLDNLGLRELLGTIAGDDTILVVPRAGVGSGRFIRALVTRVPGIERRVG